MRNFSINNKKGDGAYSSHLITWIILIASMLILLYFLSLIDFSKSIDDQMCHLGVLAKGASGEIKGVIPLNCKTSKICVTRDGSCDEKGRKKEKVSSKEEIYELLANKMADCWWMFGEGKYNFIENKVDNRNLYCSLCYDIIFDDSVASIPGLSGDVKGKNAMVLSRIEFYRYLEKHEVSEGKTYSEYMKLPSADFLEQNFQSSISNGANSAGTTSDLSDVNIPKIDLNKRQYILMGVVNKMSKLKSGAIGGIIGGGGALVAMIIFPPTGALLGFMTVVSGAFLGAEIGTRSAESLNSKDLKDKNFISTIIEGDSGNYYLTPTIVPADLNEQGYNDIVALGCKTITTTSSTSTT